MDKELLIAALARVLGISPRLANAVLAVESGGTTGHDSRMVIRFEAHIFRTELRNDDLFGKHFLLGNPSWIEHYWRPNSASDWQLYHGDQLREWQVLELAIGLRAEAALRATAMGMAQIMGFNHMRVGYETAEAMFLDYNAPGVEAEIVGFFAFVAHTPGAVSALQQGDLVGFARLYNGPANAEIYAARMRALL